MFPPRLLRRALAPVCLAFALPLFLAGAVAPAVVQDGAGNLMLKWTGEAGKHYRLEVSNDLVTWTRVPGEFTGAGTAFAPVVRAAGQATSARSFWRVVAGDSAFFRVKHSTTPELVAGAAIVPVAAGVVFGDPRAPVTYAITAGALPPGLVFNSATGTISGVPTTTGEFHFTLTATNGSLVASTPCSWAVVADPDGTAIFRDATPLSTLLPPGATTLAFSVATTQAANCRYSVGTERDYAAMTPFTNGQGTTSHGVVFTGLSADPTVVNEVFVRCDAAPTQVLRLRYRAMTAANPSFPRKANLWGWNNFFPVGDFAAATRIDLWMGVHATAAQVKPLRDANTDVIIMDSVSTVEQTDTNGVLVPDDYWLRDTNGNRIEVWDGTYRLNLTKPEVARFQARYAYHRIVDNNLCMDGVFFDNFLTTQSGLNQDKWGKPVEVDADGDGEPDDSAWLDAAWREGVYAELAEFRRLMPNALTAGHLEDHEIAEEGTVFNGDSFGFVAPWVKEGYYSNEPYDLHHLWEPYHSWWGLGRTPVISTIEGAPPSDLCYGYGSKPGLRLPASTLKFAENFFPYMRWGLGIALMNDGYYMYELGDSSHGVAWWYDELNFNLGYPKGPYQRIDLGTVPTTDEVRNGGFEAALGPAWVASVNTARGAVAAFVRDAMQTGSGTGSCRVDIAKVSLDGGGNSIPWDVALTQAPFACTAGAAYDISFKARSTSVEHAVTVGMERTAAPWGPCWQRGASFTVGNTWKSYSCVVVAGATETTGRLTISLGAKIGTVWIDDVKLVRHQPDLFRRDFDNGTVILNATASRQIIPVGGLYKRLNGAQAPLHQYVVDDADTAFAAGAWTSASYDSGRNVDIGPWFHDWGTGCHQSTSTTATASWDLGIRSNDTYTLDAWWPAAPAASGWSSAVRYDVMVNGVVVASATLDQTKNGDQWNRIAALPLTKAAGAHVRVTNLQGKPAIADAILVQSTARFNDGSDAPTVELEPYDAIVLQKK